MKKNKMMRLAAMLLVCVLLSTSVISGTFAKYVTSGSASDEARVAKFGVEIKVTGDEMFKKTYATDDTANYSSITSSVVADTAVVAPGTTSQNDLMTFSISGTPEVAVDISLALDATNEDIFLLAGDYPDYTTAAADDKFNLSADYYPIVYKLNLLSDKSQGVTESQTLVTGTLNQIQVYLNNYVNAATYAPGEELDATFSISWEWAFNRNDQADTMLGNIAADSKFAVDEAGNALVDGTDYNTEVKFGMTITVTQID